MNLERFERVLPYVNRFESVIISCWNNDKVGSHPGITVVKSAPPPDRFKCQNLHLQVASTLAGLKIAKGEMVVKTRSDEYFPKLNGDLVLSETKLSCSNIYIRNPIRIPLAMSDHLIGGSKKSLLAMFETVQHWLEMDDSSLDQEAQRLLPNKHEFFFTVKKPMSVICPEVMLFVGFLVSAGITPDHKRSGAILKNHLEVLEVEPLDWFHEKEKKHTNNSDILNQQQLLALPDSP